MTFELTVDEGALLVKFARKAVEKYTKEGETINVPSNTSLKLMEPCGVFVTINRVKGENKELRGCIGFPYPTVPLLRAVIESSINSASQDPRFYPVSAEELDSIVFEVSVLTPPTLIQVEKPSEYPSKVRVGQDGLIIERSYHKGLLLPQVPVDWNWNSEEFICHCCLKAGLSPDCWLLKDTKVYKFSCIIARELTPKGKIEIIDMRRDIRSQE